jgi:hypothetical protein
VPTPATATAETLIQKVTTNEQSGARNYEHNLGRPGGESLSRDHEEQRRTKQHQDAALAVNADSPANAHASQSNRSEKNSALDAFVSQKTETKEWQDGGRKGHDRAMNCADTFASLQGAYAKFATRSVRLSNYGMVCPNWNEAGRDAIKTADGRHLAVGIFRR